MTAADIALNVNAMPAPLSSRPESPPLSPTGHPKAREPGNPCESSAARSRLSRPHLPRPLAEAGGQEGGANMPLVGAPRRSAR
jgi:hypothetical protein